MMPSRVQTDLRKGNTSQEVDPAPGTPSHTNSYRISNIDAVEWLKSLPSDHADLVITDPPYESLEKHRAVGTTTRLKHSKSSSNDWFQVFPNNRFPELLNELYRITKPNRHFYLFCDQETMFILKPLAEATGFRFWKPLIWDKQHIGMGYHYRSRYEFILFFEKGKRRLNNLGIADIISAARIHGGYPAEKPISLIETLITQSTAKGELVIDPFIGSGSSGVAAIRNSRRFAGNDISPKAIEFALPRLAQVATPNSDKE